MNKVIIAKAICDSQDFGKGMTEAIINNIETGSELPGRFMNDQLTMYLNEAIKKANSIEDIKRDLGYAIDQFQRAAIALTKITEA